MNEVLKWFRSRELVCIALVQQKIARIYEAPALLVCVSEGVHECLHPASGLLA
jgi:hypothetical protein